MVPKLSSTAKMIARGILICRHMFYHVLIGLVYAWVLREIWGVFSFRFVALSVWGSLVMDLDHVAYFYLYGRDKTYSERVLSFIRKNQFTNGFRFMKDNHKSHTGLWSHNIYITLALLGLGAFSFLKDMETGTVIFGSMALHLLFDILDDFLVLGSLNPNWKRWGR